MCFWSLIVEYRYQMIENVDLKRIRLSVSVNSQEVYYVGVQFVQNFCLLCENCCFFQDIHKHPVERSVYNKPIVKIPTYDISMSRKGFLHLCLPQNLLNDVAITVSGTFVCLSQLCQMRVWSLRKLFLFHLYPLLNVVTLTSAALIIVTFSESNRNAPKLIKSCLFMRLKL